MLKDIFPQNAFDLGLIKSNGLIAKMFKNKEKKVYELSDYIGVMSPANKDYLIQHNPNTVDKVEVLANSILIKENNIKTKKTKKSFGLDENKMLMLYGGRIPRTQFNQ